MTTPKPANQSHPADVTFRIATAEDWPGIWRVFQQVVSTGDTYMFPPDMNEADARSMWLFENKSKHLTFIAEIESEAGPHIVGTAIIKPNQPGLGAHVANGAWMVHPHASSKGIGRRFAAYVIAQASEIGFTAMQFNAVVASNTRAIKLWHSLGFNTVGRVPKAFRSPSSELHDILVMHKLL